VSQPHGTRTLRLVAALFVVLSIGVVAGCSSSAKSGASGPQVSQPKPWVLTTPEQAVRSYLDWVSYAYRVGSSQVATPVMSGNEGVRIDSYLELNRQQGKRIEQQLTSITLGKQSVEGTHTLVPTHETWTYAYVSLTDGKQIGQTDHATYDATYTVVSPRQGQWVVDSVVAKPIGQVK
jgi:hypothetical protein